MSASCFKRLPTGEWVPDAEMNAKCREINLLHDGDAHYAKELLESHFDSWYKQRKPILRKP